MQFQGKKTSKPPFPLLETNTSTRFSPNFEVYEGSQLPPIDHDMKYCTQPESSQRAKDPVLFGKSLLIHMDFDQKSYPVVYSSQSLIDYSILWVDFIHQLYFVFKKPTGPTGPSITGTNIQFTSKASPPKKNPRRSHAVASFFLSQNCHPHVVPETVTATASNSCGSLP